MAKRTRVGADSDGFDRLLGQMGPVAAMRVKLGVNRLADQPDPLGRWSVGWRSGLSTSDLWERGRGVWKAKATQILDSEILLITFEDEVKLVGTIEGLTKHDERLAIIGQPIADHPLIGQRDPLFNRSSNPVAYGVYEASRADGMQTGDWD